MIHLLDDAKKLAIEFTPRRPVWVREIDCGQGMRRPPSDQTPPKGSGVYVFRKNERVKYIGLAIGKKGLRRRICGDHISPGKRDTSDFRDKVAAEEGLIDSEGVIDRVAVLQRMRESYSVVWLEIPKPEMCVLVEKLVIAWAMAENQPLLNEQGRD